MDKFEEQQDTTEVRQLLDRQAELEAKRRPYDTIWREIDERIDPKSHRLWSGGNSSPQVYGERLIDQTAIRGLRRFTAAIGGITIPRGRRYIDITFPDKELMKVDAVQRWCVQAAEILHACRYAPHSGFEGQAFQSIRSLGKYGPNAMEVSERVGVGLVYRSIHLSEIWIDEDYAGLVDTVHRKYQRSVRQAAQEFGLEMLPPKMREAHEKGRLDERFEFIRMVRPNSDRKPGRFGAAGMAYESIHVACDEKAIVRRAGFRTKPIMVARHGTDSSDIYGDSVALDALPAMRVLNEMARTIIRAAHKAVDPPLLFNNDGDISKIITKPGGLNPGGVDEFGRQMIQPLITGAQLPIGIEMYEREQQGVKDGFLEEFFRLLSDPSDRMTATQVLEQVQKEGILISPFAARHETEMEAPRVERELDILMSANQIPPFPPEASEARAKPRAQMDNPLARMQRAEEAAGFTRLMELTVQAETIEENVRDIIDVEEGLRIAAYVLGVPTRVVRTPEVVAQIREGREGKKQISELAAIAPPVAGAALDLAKANQIAEAA